MTNSKLQAAKQFDCISLKRTIQSQIITETDGMSTKELLEYFNSGGAGLLQGSRKEIIKSTSQGAMT
jgi:hypothetical protein